MGYDKAEYFVIELTAQLQRSASPPSASTNWNSAKVVHLLSVSSFANMQRYFQCNAEFRIFYARHLTSCSDLRRIVYRAVVWNYIHLLPRMPPLKLIAANVRSKAEVGSGTEVPAATADVSVP